MMLQRKGLLMESAHFCFLFHPQTHVMKMDPGDKSLTLSPVQKVRDT